MSYPKNTLTALPLTKISLALCVAAFSASVTASTIPYTFSAGSPARAYQVNENFNTLLAETTTNAEAIAKNITSLSRTKIIVDCTDTPSALQDAYIKNIDRTQLNLEITGRCYADFSTPNGEQIEQRMGQTISIYAKEDIVATLIPDATSGNISLWGGFNGGLYLNNLTVEAAATDPIGFSRNSQGNLTNITIIGSGSNNSAKAVLVQASAQVYFADVTITNMDTAIEATGNSSIRFINSKNENGEWVVPALTISNVNTGISMTAAASIRQQGTVNITAAIDAINMTGASSWDSKNWTENSFAGNINISGNSYASLSNFNFSGTSINVSGSELFLSNTTFDKTTLRCTLLGKVQIEGVDDLLAVEPNSNCIDNAAATRLVDLLKPAL